MRWELSPTGDQHGVLAVTARSRFFGSQETDLVVHAAGPAVSIVLSGACVMDALRAMTASDVTIGFGQREWSYHSHPNRQR